MFVSRFDSQTVWGSRGRDSWHCSLIIGGGGVGALVPGLNVAASGGLIGRGVCLLTAGLCLFLYKKKEEARYIISTNPGPSRRGNERISPGTSSDQKRRQDETSSSTKKSAPLVGINPFRER